MDEESDDDRVSQKDSINQGDFVSGDKIERQVLHQQTPGAPPVQPAQVQQPPQVVYVQQKGSSGFNALMWMTLPSARSGAPPPVEGRPDRDRDGAG